MKKASYIILTLIMLFGLVSLCACNNATPTDNSDYIDPTPVDYFTFEPNADRTGYILTGTQKILPANVVIPSEYDGLPVTEIGAAAFDGCTEIESVTLNENIISIGHSVFSGCSSLKSVDFNSANINKIPISTFYKCSSLSAVDIPNSVIEIYSSAFESCSSLQEIHLPKQLNYIGDSAFANCTALTDIVFPDTVEQIGANAFANCTSLTTLNFPPSLKHIYSYAFSNCIALQNITFSEGLISIWESAFSNCTSLTELYFPQSLEWLCSSSTERAVNITYLLTKPLTKETLIAHSDIEVSFGSALITIHTEDYFNKGAFSGCPNLTNVKISKNTYIMPCSFLGAINVVITYF